MRLKRERRQVAQRLAGGDEDEIVEEAGARAIDATRWLPAEQVVKERRREKSEPVPSFRKLFLPECCPLLPERPIGVLNRFSTAADRVVDVHIGLGIVRDMQEDVPQEIFVVGDPRAGHPTMAMMTAHYVVDADGDPLSSRRGANIGADLFNIRPAKLLPAEKQVMEPHSLIVDYNSLDKTHPHSPEEHQ